MHNSTESMTKKKRVNKKEKETKKKEKNKGIMTNREKAKIWKFSVAWCKYGCQSHDLLAAKLNAYGLETPL